MRPFCQVTTALAMDRVQRSLWPAAMGGVPLVELVENTHLGGLVHAGAAVPDGHHRLRTQLPQAHLHRAALQGKLGRIVQQVHPHLLHQCFAAGIAALLAVQVDLDGFFCPFPLYHDGGLPQLFRLRRKVGKIARLKTVRSEHRPPSIQTSPSLAGRGKFERHNT